MPPEINNQQNLFDSARWIVVAAALFGLLAVAFGAFGAHALKNTFDTYSMGIYETAARYQLAHALALMLVGLASLARVLCERWLRYSAIAFTLGMLLFSGSLYFLAFSGIRWLGAITPLGGFLLILGWGFIAVAALKTRQ